MPRGGRTAETTALAAALERAGVVAPHSGEPLTEAMLFGIGGGIGGAYLLREIRGGVRLHLGFRAGGDTEQADFLASICRRLGAEARIRETGSDRAALAHLGEGLALGLPVVVWVGLGAMPYAGLPSSPSSGPAHVALVTGFDEASGIVHVADRTPHPLAVTAKELALARAAIPALRRRSMVVLPPRRSMPFEKAVLGGIRAGTRAFLRPPNERMGVRAFATWSRSLVDPRDRRGWPKALANGASLANALVAITTSIETGGSLGTGSGACRAIYADFLHEAGAALGRPAIALAAPRYRELAALWTALAEAALPVHAPLFAEAKALVLRRSALFEEKGQAGAEERRGMAQRLAAIERSCGKAFPFDAAAVEALRHDLSARLAALYELERAAALEVRAALEV